MTKDDCEMQVFRSGGKGGQHQNKTSSGVRWIHHPSGARGEARDERSQAQNKQVAWRRLAESDKFKNWLRLEIARRTGEEALIQEAVNAEMADHNLLVEVVEAGKWVRAC